MKFYGYDDQTFSFKKFDMKKKKGNIQEAKTKTVEPHSLEKSILPPDL